MRSTIGHMALAASLVVVGTGLCLTEASAQGYGGPSYEGRDTGRDRDWRDHSDWEGRSGRPESWMERRQFERGYRLGRRDALDETQERSDSRPASDKDRAADSDRGERQGGRGERAEPSRQALGEARDLLQDARGALRRADRRAAEDALDRAARVLRPDEERRPALDRSLDAVERALDHDDRDAALSALRRAREAAREQRAADETSNGSGGSDKSAPDKGGAAPAPAPRDAPAPGGKT